MLSLIINADDFLLHESIDVAIIELLNDFSISNTTAMMCVDNSSDRFSEKIGDLDTKRIGLHLQLTSGRPLSDNVASLVDGDTGAFLQKEKLNDLVPEEIHREWLSQLEQYRRVVGHLPSHLDSHHGVHQLEQAWPAYLNIAHTYGLPVRSGSIDTAAKIKASGVACPDVCIGGWSGSGLAAADLMREIDTVSLEHAADSIEIVCHPSLLDQSIRKISSLNDERYQDYVQISAFAAMVRARDDVTLVCHKAV